MKIIAGGGMNCWTKSVTHSAGVSIVRFTGIVTNRCLVEFWRRPPLVAAILFDFLGAVITYRVPVSPETLDAQRAGPPAAILCNAGDYELFARRADALNAVGVRRMVFLSAPLALEWTSMQARLSRARSTSRTRARDVPVFPGR